MFYAEWRFFSTLFVEKLRERFSNLSQPRQNLSLSFQNLSVSVATYTQNVLLGVS